jgi:hypothetical protein
LLHHHRAYTTAAGKEKAGYVYLPLHFLPGNCFTMLIGKRETRNSMSNPLVGLRFGQEKGGKVRGVVIWYGAGLPAATGKQGDCPAPPV